jgi:hypothetical protein
VYAYWSVGNERVRQVGGAKHMPITPFPSLGSMVTHTTMARSG